MALMKVLLKWSLFQTHIAVFNLTTMVYTLIKGDDNQHTLNVVIIFKYLCFIQHDLQSVF